MHWSPISIKVARCFSPRSGHPETSQRGLKHRATSVLGWFFLGLLLPLAAHAQTVHWDTDPNSPSYVQLVFDGCAPDGQPTLPTVPDATLTFVGQSQNTSIVNFTMTSSITLSYFVRAKKTGPVHIPEFTVKTNKGTLRVAAFDGASPAAALETVANAKLLPERTSVWAGEVFGLTYELSASHRNNPQGLGSFDWNAAPLVAEDWSKPEVTEAVVSGDRRVQVTYRTRVYAKTPNTIKLEAASVVLNIQTGTVGFGFLSQPRMEPISVTSDQPVIEVKPLPQAPADFSGAVGQFKLTSKVVPEKAGVGEPITWTLELSGSGNWPDIAGLPARDVSRDFQVVQPKPKRTPAEGKLFDVTLTDDVVLVPSKAGDYFLGPLSFTYFDPKAGSYRVLNVPRTKLTITPPPAPQITLPSAQAAAANQLPKSAPAAAPPSNRTPAPVATAPSGVPRDPLPGSDVAPQPLTMRQLVVGCAAPFVAVLGFWLFLAIRRAHQTDPLHVQRAARARVATTLAALEKAGDTDRPALLLVWQRDSAVLWQIGHAAPRATFFAEPWATLWRESERALYGEKPALPPDWLVRAHEALAGKRVPGFQVRRLFLPRNLFPFAAAIALLLVTSFVSLHAEDQPAADSAKTDGAAAYRKADFAAAEKAWRAALAKSPSDSFARHNLSLALTQQERFGEAAAQSAAAFVQNPPEKAIRWQFGLATEKAGAAPPTLAAFLNPGPLQELAGHLSPSEWQRVLIIASSLAAFALAGVLANAYGRRQRFFFWTAGGVFALGVGLALASVASIGAYGLASDARAIVVSRAGLLRSIPTEADTTQKTAPLSQGSLAVVDKSLLGWVRLSFENGQTGWVRKEEVVPIWR